MTVLVDTAPAYAVLGTFRDTRHHGRFDVGWNGRAVTVTRIDDTADTHPYTIPADTGQDQLARTWAAGGLAYRMIADATRRAHEPHPGRTVRSLTTRGRHKGATGLVKRVGVDHEAAKLRVLVQFGTELRWLSADRVEVIGGVGHVPTESLTNQAAHLAATMSWASLAMLLGMRS